MVASWFPLRVGGPLWIALASPDWVHSRKQLPHRFDDLSYSYLSIHFTSASLFRLRSFLRLRVPCTIEGVGNETFPFAITRPLQKHTGRPTVEALLYQ